jgi:hypothetical protein
MELRQDGTRIEYCPRLAADGKFGRSTLRPYRHEISSPGTQRIRVAWPIRSASIDVAGQRGEADAREFTVSLANKNDKTNPIAPLLATPKSKNKPNQTQFIGFQTRAAVSNPSAGVINARHREAGCQFFG